MENGIDDALEEIEIETDEEDNVCDDEELLGDLLRKRPKENDAFDSAIVVDGIPVVDSDRQEKLMNVLKKLFSKFGTITSEYLPMDENKKTKGYFFLEFSDAKEAQEAVRSAQGYKLDKAHTFSVNMLTDFEKYENVSVDYEPPKPQAYKDHGNLKSWLLDKNCYDQFSVIYEGGEKTAIYLNSVGEPTVAEQRTRWTETYVRWSPQGTYLATFHAKGIALWGGKDFKQIMRFQHPGVQLIDYSPCERYVVTFSPLPDNKEDPQSIIIFEIRTGQKKRGFHCENAATWPVFKWSFDGKYFARMSTDMIMVYETPSFGLLDKKSFKIPNVKDFAWSPSDSIISYWTPELREQPARVVLVQIPSRNILCQKNLFTVKECRLHWQTCGNYLCVKVDRYKSKKEEKDITKYSGLFHNFNIFRIREKEIPVDIVELQDTIQAFAWEPVGHKFAVIHGEPPRICVSFYQVKTQGSVELLKTFEKKQVNHLFWSPAGQFIVLAGLRSMNGVLEFLDTNDMSIMQVAEHFMATDVEFDPTGRYVATGVSWWGHKVDNAFWLWNFQGKLLHKQPLEKFCQLLWRPCPPTLLNKELIKEVKKNYKKYSQIFSVEDKMRESKASKEQIERRRALISDYEQWVKDLQEKVRDSKKQRIDLRGINTDALTYEADEEEEVVEFLVNVETIELEE